MREYFSTETAYYFETPPYNQILSFIGDGKSNAIHKSELVRFTGLADRELRKIIEFLRRKGIVIISDNNGYYFPQNESELKTYIHQEECRAKSTFYTLKSARLLLMQLKKL